MIKQILARVVAEQIARMPQVQPRAHTKPCRNCPSAHFPLDPESEDMMKEPKQFRLESAFPCGWAGKRYCKGYCDLMGITNADLAEHHATGKTINAWPFPIGGPPPQDRGYKPIPFNPNNHEEAPW